MFPFPGHNIRYRRHLLHLSRQQTIDKDFNAAGRNVQSWTIFVKCFSLFHYTTPMSSIQLSSAPGQEGSNGSAICQKILRAFNPLDAPLQCCQSTDHLIVSHPAKRLLESISRTLAVINNTTIRKKRPSTKEFFRPSCSCLERSGSLHWTFSGLNASSQFGYFQL